MHNTDSKNNSLSILPDESLFKQRMLSVNSDDTYESEYIPDIMKNDIFLPAFLSKNMGRWVKAELLIGNSLVPKIGQLIKVGAGFIVLKLNTNPVSSVVCDINSIRFVTIIYSGKIKE